VINAFIRITTNPWLHNRPLLLREAVTRIDSWLQKPCVRVVGQTEFNWVFFQKQMSEVNAIENLISCEHLAALAIEHGSTLYSAGRDFARFQSLK
jgi:hypothetical protein